MDINIYVTGKVNIQLNVNVPSNMQLVEQLQEGSLWCQARGVATIVSEVEEVAVSSEKVLTFRKGFNISFVCVCICERELF